MIIKLALFLAVAVVTVNACGGNNSAARPFARSSPVRAQDLKRELELENDQKLNKAAKEDYGGGQGEDQYFDDQVRTSSAAMIT